MVCTVHTLQSYNLISICNNLCNYVETKHTKKEQLVRYL